MQINSSLLNSLIELNQEHLELFILICSLDCTANHFLYFTSEENRIYISDLAKKYVPIFINKYAPKFKLNKKNKKSKEERHFKIIDNFYDDCNKINDQFLIFNFYKILKNYDYNCNIRYYSYLKDFNIDLVQNEIRKILNDLEILNDNLNIKLSAAELNIVFLFLEKKDIYSKFTFLTFEILECFWDLHLPKSNWDLSILNNMQEEFEFEYIAPSMISVPGKLEYLYEWKRLLGNKKFEIIKSYISKEIEFRFKKIDSSNQISKQLIESAFAIF